MVERIVFYGVLIIAQWEIKFENCRDNNPEYHPSTSLVEFINSLINMAQNINCILLLFDSVFMTSRGQKNKSLLRVFIWCGRSGST